MKKLNKSQIAGHPHKVEKGAYLSEGGNGVNIAGGIKNLKFMMKYPTEELFYQSRRNRELYQEVGDSIIRE